MGSNNEKRNQRNSKLRKLEKKPERKPNCLNCFKKILVGGGINGNIIINVQSGHIPIDPLNLTSFAITENIFNPFPNSGRLIVNGVNNVNTRVRATVDSIPIRSRVTLVGTNTSLIRVNDAFGLAYTPTVPADYDPPIPTNVQEALDQLAARVRALGG
jgi:hypothetical protein